jgi:AAA domain
MSRPRINRLRVTGAGKPAAEIEFGPGLTLITGMSDTGKTHVLECIDYALAAKSPPRPLPESIGYGLLCLELRKDADTYVIARSLTDPEIATIHVGSLADAALDEGQNVKVHISAAKDPRETLSGWLLALCGFDPHTPVIKNQKGDSQSLSFRNVVPFVLVNESEVIDTRSPVLSPQQIQQTASRSVFQMLLTGEAPSPEELAALQKAHRQHETARQRVDLLDPIIGELREEIQKSGGNRQQLEADLESIDQELATVSEAVSASGDRVRALIEQRNAALRRADKAERKAASARELTERFGLLAQHYTADVRRLEFVLEGGHFFQQLTATHCPTCGREIEPEAQCHPESDDYEQIERSARVEIDKLTPRMQDLIKAIDDAGADTTGAEELAASERARGQHLDAEIKQVANPSADAARGRVRAITVRRREIEGHLLRFRELDRYVQARQEAVAAASRKLDRYRPEQDLPSLQALSAEIRSLLNTWKFPLQTDLFFNTETDDLMIDGKSRQAFGKGARAITHAAFTIGLMNYCLARNTPHPGFVAIDTPLTPFRGVKDEIADPELTRDVHTGFLYSLAVSQTGGQAIVIENVEAPNVIRGHAAIHEFDGPDGPGRNGFYP